MKNQVLVFVLSVLTVSASWASENYCVAIRGNGQLAPAHWSGMSRIVESKGLPQAMAGGSSASVSMFLIESIGKSNAIDSTASDDTRKKQQALFLKTIPFYFQTLARLESIDSTFKFISDLNKSDSDLTQKVQQIIAQDSLDSETVEKQLKELGPLFNTEQVQSLVNANALQSSAAVARLQEALSVFGKFDAANDKNLFFRAGLIDFKYFALLLGKVADFYAGTYLSKTLIDKQKNFLAQCSDEAVGQIWPTPQIHDKCQGLFVDAVSTYLSENPSLNPQSEIFAPIGKEIASFPVTSVLVGEGFDKYQAAKANYNQFKEDGLENFSVKGESLKFGYWGPSEKVLSDVSSQLKSLYPNDLKSQKFYSLGNATWFDVIATSPAEPGLANFQRITENSTASLVLTDLQKGMIQRWGGLNYKEGIISGGGWPDLHPTLVLKAYKGCEKVVYMTRRGAGSVFGQQIFIRLSELQNTVSFWKELTGTASDLALHKSARPSALTTDWNSIYNVSNEQSSFNLSLQESDEVYCTNWDSFDLFKENGLTDLVVDSYFSPLIVPSEVNSEDFPGCTSF